MCLLIMPPKMKHIINEKGEQDPVFLSMLATCNFADQVVTGLVQ
jgi:hypothetical protein